MNKLIFRRVSCLLFLATIAVSLPDYAYAGVDFMRLNGSDLSMGVGARAISMGGAYVASADDASAVFWNPAGLTRLKNNQVFFAAYLPDEFSAGSIIFRTPPGGSNSVNLAVGLSRVNRLRFRGDSGDDTWDGYPSHLLDLSMVDAGDDFRGIINSKTRDSRISLAFRFPGSPRWSWGLNYVALR